MVDPATPQRMRLRVSPGSIVLAIAMLGLTLTAMRIVEASGRVLGWMVSAAAVAALLELPVRRLARRMPRGAAVLVVVVSLLAGTALVGVPVGRSIAAQIESVQRAAPRAAARLERSDRYGDVARQLNLRDRTRVFIDAVPERLRGGSPADALRSAATRGVAFLTTAILSLFLLLHGPNLASSALAQLDEPRRTRARTVVWRAHRRTAIFALGTGVTSVIAGLVTYVTARGLGIPGAAALGAWSALWDLVPLVGFVIGSAPVVVLVAATSGSTTAWIVALGLIAYQAVEVTTLQRWVDRHALRLGPALTVGSGLIGLEAYGLGGMLISVLTTAGGVALLQEWSRSTDASPGVSPTPAGQPTPLSPDPDPTPPAAP